MEINLQQLRDRLYYVHNELVYIVYNPSIITVNFMFFFGSEMLGSYDFKLHTGLYMNYTKTSLICYIIEHTYIR